MMLTIFRIKKFVAVYICQCLGVANYPVYPENPPNLIISGTVTICFYVVGVHFIIHIVLSLCI